MQRDFYCKVYQPTAERVSSSVIVELGITVASRLLQNRRRYWSLYSYADMYGFRVYWRARVHTIPNKIKPNSETQCDFQMEMLPAHTWMTACTVHEGSRFSRGLSRSLSS